MRWLLVGSLILAPAVTHAWTNIDPQALALAYQMQLVNGKGTSHGRGEPSQTPVQLQMQRVQQAQPQQGLYATQPILQAVPVQAWDGTVTVPVVIKLGFGQAQATTFSPQEMLNQPPGGVHACNARGECVPCPCMLRY